MSPIQRNIVAIVVGLVIGCAVNMAIVIAGPALIPLPEGIDMSDMSKFAENLKQLKPVHFIAPWLAHALGTLVGAFVAAKLAATHKMKFALAIGGLFLLGGLAMVASYGGPTWFVALDLIVAYVPMAYLGAVLAGADQQPNSQRQSEGP